MALVKQIVPISFSQGIDTKTDATKLPIGKMEAAENVIYETTDALRKRNGYTEISRYLFNGDRISNLARLATFDDELIAFDESKLYTYSNSLEKWGEKGSAYHVFATSEDVIRNAKEQSGLDSVSSDNLNFYTWADSSGVKYSVLDRANENFIVADNEISSTGIKPRIAKIGSSIFLFYIDGTDLNYRRINAITPETLGSEITVAADVDGTNKFLDIIGIGDRIAYAYNSNDATDKLKARSIDENEVLSSELIFAGEQVTTCLNLSVDSNFRLMLSFYDGTDIKFATIALNFSTTLIPVTTIETIAGVTNCASMEISDENYRVLYEVSAASSADYYTKKADIDSSATITGLGDFLRSVGLASKRFNRDGTDYILMLHQSTLQSTYFLVDEDAVLISKALPNVGGDHITTGAVPNVSQIDDNFYLIPTQIKGRTVTDNGTFDSVLGVNSSEFEFNTTRHFLNTQLGGNLHIAGGILQQYDGKQIVEHGFNVFPEDATAGATSTVGGVLSDGTYLYTAVFAWTDNKGQLHRSAPSAGTSVVLSGVTSTQTQIINIPTLRLTDKTDVVLELYRTEANGTISYKLTDVDSPIFNDKTVDSIAFTDDTITDADLISREILYTTGGVLENIAPPSSTLLATYKSRVFLAGLEDGNQIHYSKIRLQDTPVEFNDVLTFEMEDRGGPITALGVLNEKLIIFKEDALYYITGDGPNNLGQQNTFIEPELVSQDVGCINPDSVVLSPAGLFFQSKKGIYQVTDSLQTRYVGSFVEEFNDLTITSAQVIDDLNQIRFTTSDGACLVYNYFVGFWATFTNHEALSAVTVKSVYHYLREDSRVYAEDFNTFSDNGVPIKMRIETSWMSFAGLQGFQRVYKMLMYGSYKSPHKIKVKVGYDYDSPYIQEKTLDTSDFTDDTKYGVYSPYGDPSTLPYGGNGNHYQFRLDFKRQKCQAIKIRIEDVQNDPGEGLILSGITLEVGGKAGTFKLPTSNRYGTE